MLTQIKETEVYLIYYWDDAVELWRIYRLFLESEYYEAQESYKKVVARGYKALWVKEYKHTEVIKTTDENKAIEMLE